MIHLVRHADAGDRGRFVGDDRERPLSELGRWQSEAIARRLIERPIVRALSSPYARCIATLEPLAAQRELVVDSTGFLAEGHDPERVARMLLEELAQLEPPGELVACSHGDVIPYVIEHYVANGARYLGGRSSPKAVTFTCTVAGGEVVDVERVAPPKPSRAGPVA